VYGRLNVNVALNRPAFMSGTHNDPVYGGDFPASRAVDGNNDPIALKVDNSCAVSTAGDNPWWAVDLGAALVVVGVLFTNRGETLGNVSSSTSAVFELSKRKKATQVHRHVTYAVKVVISRKRCTIASLPVDFLIVVLFWPR